MLDDFTHTQRRSTAAAVVVAWHKWYNESNGLKRHKWKTLSPSLTLALSCAARTAFA